MVRWRKVAVAAGIIAVVAVVFIVRQTLAAPAAIGVAVGERAPNFTLKTLDGQTISLRSLRGKPVVINFWASWCGPCRAELPALEKIHQTYSGQVNVIGVDLTVEETSPEGLRAFVESHGVTYPIGLDGTGRVAVEYAVSGIPTTYVLNGDGIVVDVLTQSTSYEGFVQAIQKAL